MWSRQCDSALPEVLHTYLQFPKRQWKWNLLAYLQSFARQGSLEQSDNPQGHCRPWGSTPSSLGFPRLAPQAEREGQRFTSHSHSWGCPLGLPSCLPGGASSVSWHAWLYHDSNVAGSGTAEHTEGCLERCMLGHRASTDHTLGLEIRTTAISSWV